MEEREEGRENEWARGRANQVESLNNGFKKLIDTV